MKSFFFVFLTVIFSAGLSLQAQNWSLPQDNKPKNTITWATPAEMTLSFDYPFKGAVEYYDHYGTQKQRRKNRTGTYTLRIPNKFKGSGLIGKGYSHKYKEVTWAIGEPDPSAGYTETRVSWKSDWQATAEDPVVSWRTENDVGTVTFLNDVVINGSVAFSKGPARYYSGMEIGHRCYSSLDDDGISSNCYGLEQFVFNSDTDLYYTFVKAANDSNAIILWGIFSTSSRYANQSNNMSTAPAKSSSSNSQSASVASAGSGWLGVAIVDVTERETKYFGYKVGEGLIVVNVFDGSPASAAGVDLGDLIVSIDGKRISDSNEFVRIISGKSQGSKVVLRVRKSLATELVELDVPIVLGKRS